MMFARRSGVEATPGERRSIRAAFVASYLMLLASFETGGSTDPLILSLGLAAKYTLPARLVLAAAFAVFLFFGFRRMVQRSGARALAAPLTLALTQFIWFVVPTLLELHAQYQIPQTRYSSGILAVLHSAQYIWITSYYQQREARAAGQAGWRLTRYFLTLVAGGIALFIPGPWIVSRVLHFDFTTSFLIFTAVVNIHHFILDGALWKLRDSRISAVLIDGGAKPQENRKKAAPSPSAATGSGAASFHRPAFRVSLVALLFLWGGMDQVRFALGTHEANLSALVNAARMNPYDSVVQARIASAQTKAGDRSAAIDALERAVNINPYDARAQQALGLALLQDGRYQDAYERYAKVLELFPRDPNALVNYGILAARLGHPEEAMDSWEKAVTVDPNQPNAHLYLAAAFDQKGEFAAAARHWDAFLRSAAANPDDPAAGIEQQISAAIQLADDQSRINRTDAALAGYHSAISMAQHAGRRQARKHGARASGRPTGKNRGCEVRSRFVSAWSRARRELGRSARGSSRLVQLWAIPTPT